MELEIRPEPSPDERAAIEAALAALAAAEREEPRGAWWREGLRESLDQSQSS